MIDKSSEAYGEKGYKLGNHLFHTPARDENVLISEQMMSITTMTGLISRVKKLNVGLSQMTE